MGQIAVWCPHTPYVLENILVEFLSLSQRGNLFHPRALDSVYNSERGRKEVYKSISHTFRLTLGIIRDTACCVVIFLFFSHFHCLLFSQGADPTVWWEA
ncbi:hypothetical protein AVEN_100854-1 [Araneus ventricosus]|uniref:Uncharacterized protein n=1 Tax=Araneus ventricosus TaxID=182803 RepID=A0A4Y2AV76_ARAVE|nr:hypothetical protein AVEN_100854-1 [Araneus ventricosus]